MSDTKKPDEKTEDLNVAEVTSLWGRWMTVLAKGREPKKKSEKAVVDEFREVQAALKRFDQPKLEALLLREGLITINRICKGCTNCWAPTAKAQNLIIN